MGPEDLMDSDLRGTFPLLVGIEAVGSPFPCRTIIGFVLVRMGGDDETRFVNKIKGEQIACELIDRESIYTRSGPKR